MAQTDRLLTVPQVAERLGLSAETVRRWLRSGRLPGTHLGSDKAGWRVGARELEAFIKDGRNERTREVRRP